MITAAVSALLGAASGLAPEVLKFLNLKADRAHELAVLRLQADLARAGHQQRLEEIRQSSYVAELDAYAEQMKAIQEAQARPSGVRFVDGFNALIRPAAAAAVMAFFIGASGMLAWATITDVAAGRLGMPEAAGVIFGSLIGEAIQAVLGFLFGYRSTAAAARLGRA